MADDKYKPPEIIVRDMDGNLRVLDPKDPEDLKLIRKQIGLQLVTGDKSGDKKAYGGRVKRKKKRLGGKITYNY
jgi:hypothetical protein